MPRQKLTSIGGGAAIIGGMWISLIQGELDIPWMLVIGILLISWAGGLAGLFLHSQAGRVGRASLALSLLGIGGLLAGIAIGDALEAFWWIFIILVNLIPAGLILHGIAALRIKAFRRTGGLTMVLGLLILAWINFIEPAWPLWIENAAVFAIGVCWVVLGLSMIRIRSSVTAAPSGSYPNRSAGSALAPNLISGLVLIPFLLLQGWVWLGRARAASCPAIAGSQLLDLASLPKPVIIDTDMAHEDMFAVLFLLQHPAAEVLGITVAGTGEAHCEPGVRNARGLTALHGEPDLPVACGPERPLAGDHKFPAAWRAGADSVYGVHLPANPAPAPDITAQDLIVDLVQGAEQKVTLVAVGPLTNLALAFQAAPGLADRIEMIYIMGGAVEIGGNVGMSGVGIDNPVAEWNIYIDTHAANIVLESGAPVTLVPLNATRHVPVTTEFYRCIQNNHPTPEAAFVYEVLKANYDFIETGGFQFWDSLTAAIFLDNRLAEFEDMELVVVEAEGPSSGLTLPKNGGAPVRVAVAADGDAFESLFFATLNSQARK